VPPDGTLPLDEHEYDRILLEQDRELGLALVGELRPGVRLGNDADEQRRSRIFTGYDGKLDPEYAQHIAWTAGRGPRAISPSRLETYATCPFKFFLRYVLRLEPVEEPETLERIDPLNRGSLIHEILELFLQDLRSRGERPSRELRDEHLARLFGIAERACEHLESTGLVGFSVLWEYDQIAIFEDLEEWYDAEVADLSSTSLQPETFELRFGWARRKDEGGEGSRDEPFELQFPGGVMRFQGRVDRVDVMPDRSSFRVIDYKTGRAGSYKPDTFNGGRSLQLPIYLLAASDLLGMPWERSQAEYFFPTRRGEFQRIPMHGWWLTENYDELIELLNSISQAISSGLFPQVTDIGNQDNCRNCDYQELCPVNVRSLVQRKQTDESVFWLRQVIEAES
jgi:ATP-dependent helicase/nuclease subunit B